MSQGNTRTSQLFIAGAYFFLFLLVFWPVVDLATTGWPFRPGDVQWRYGFMGLMTAYSHTPILAMLLAMGLAFVLRHRKTLRLISFLCLVGAVGLLIVLILFPLDVIQLRSVTPPENLQFFQTGALLSELKHLTAGVTLFLLGLGGWRTAGTMAKLARSTSGSNLTAEVIKTQKRD
jgi:hypothetical protein